MKQVSFITSENLLNLTAFLQKLNALDTKFLKLTESDAIDNLQNLIIENCRHFLDLEDTKDVALNDFSPEVIVSLQSCL